MSHYCTICGNMVPAQGTHHCQRYDRVFVAGTMYEPDEISKLKLVIKAKNKYVEIQDIIISGQRKEIGTKDKEIARLRAALQEIADYDYQCQCTEGIEDGEEHFGCPSCWARAALKEAK